MDQGLSPDFHDQGGDNRSATNQSLACGQRRQFCQIRSGKVIGSFLYETLIVWVLDSHSDDRIALTCHVCIQLAGTLAHDREAHTEFPALGGNPFDDVLRY
jgi:hypothetical protein